MAPRWSSSSRPARPGAQPWRSPRRGRSRAAGRLAAAAQGAGRAGQPAAAHVASRRGIWLLAGSLYEPVPVSRRRVYNTSALFGPRARSAPCTARSSLRRGLGRAVYRESSDVAAGEAVVSADLAGARGGPPSPCRSHESAMTCAFPSCIAPCATRRPPAVRAGGLHRLHRRRPLGAAAAGLAPWRTAASSSRRTRWGSISRARLLRAQRDRRPLGDVLAVRADDIGLCVADLELEPRRRGAGADPVAGGSPAGRLRTLTPGWWGRAASSAACFGEGCCCPRHPSCVENADTRLDRQRAHEAG